MPSLEFRRVLFRSEEHTSELQSHDNLVCRLLLEKKPHPRAHRLPYPPRQSRAPHAPALPRATVVSVVARGSAWSGGWTRRGRQTWFFFFNDPAPTEIYTLPLHDALPIYRPQPWPPPRGRAGRSRSPSPGRSWSRDRKSTRLNSSHTIISYAVFCLKKKKKQNTQIRIAYLSRGRDHPRY